MKRAVYLLIILVSAITISCNSNPSFKLRNGACGGFYQQMENGKMVRFEDSVYYIDTINFISFNEVAEVQLGEPDPKNGIEHFVSFKMTEKGAKKINEFSKNNLNKPLFVMIDSEVYAAPLMLYELQGDFNITFRKKEDAELLIYILTKKPPGK